MSFDIQNAQQVPPHVIDAAIRHVLDKGERAQCIQKVWAQPDRDWLEVVRVDGTRKTYPFPFKAAALSGFTTQDLHAISEYARRHDIDAPYYAPGMRPVFPMETVLLLNGIVIHPTTNEETPPMLNITTPHVGDAVWFYEGPTQAVPLAAIVTYVHASPGQASPETCVNLQVFEPHSARTTLQPSVQHGDEKTGGRHYRWPSEA